MQDESKKNNNKKKENKIKLRSIILRTQIELYCLSQPLQMCKDKWGKYHLHKFGHLAFCRKMGMDSRGLYRWFKGSISISNERKLINMKILKGPLP